MKRIDIWTMGNHTLSPDACRAQNQDSVELQTE